MSLPTLDLQFFRRADLLAMAWKNGGGITHEIVCQPPGVDMDSFDWRVSIAEISSDGQFSSFAGVDRVITLLHGGAIQLSSSDGRVDRRLEQPLQPFAFAGEAAVECRLLAGPCEDLNVMTRRRVCRATVQVLRGATDWHTRAEGLLYAAQGSWQLRGTGDTVQQLETGAGLFWKHGAAGGAAGQGPSSAWQLMPQSPASALIAVAISRLPVAASKPAAAGTAHEVTGA